MLLLRYLLAGVLAAAAQRDALLPASALRADLAVLRQVLEEGHSGLRRYTTAAEFNQAVAAADRRLAAPMTSAQLYRVLAPLLALVKCGHTMLVLSDSLRQHLVTEERLLPFRVRFVGGAPFVVRDFSSDSGKVAGFELRSINGRSVDSLVGLLLAGTSADGDIETWKRAALSDFRFATNLVALTGIRAPYQLVLRKPSTGRLVRLRSTGLTLPDLRTAARARYPDDSLPTPAAQLELLRDGRIARMTIRRFIDPADSARGELFPEFLARAFTTLRDRRTAALVIDLRDNGGGEDAYGKLLLSYLVARPFDYYRDLVLNGREFSFRRLTRTMDDIPPGFARPGPDGKLHGVTHPNLGRQLPSAPGFTGPVVVLMNGGSVSTTAEFISMAHSERRATFVGEEAGGAYLGNTSGFEAEVVLPNSKLVLYLPLISYYLAATPDLDPRHGVAPDYPVAPTVEDLMAGRDPVWEKGLALALSGVS
jgi:hypothetical protein